MGLLDDDLVVVEEEGVQVVDLAVGGRERVNAGVGVGLENLMERNLVEERKGHVLRAALMPGPKKLKSGGSIVGKKTGRVEMVARIVLEKLHLAHRKIEREKLIEIRLF